MYEHEKYLEQVPPEDQDHVDFMLRKLDDYAKTGAPIGDFLTAVVMGDLGGAAAHADGTNKKYLRLYSNYCYNQLPSDKQSLLCPVVRDLQAVLKKRGWMTRGQVAEASNMFRSLLVDIMDEEAEKQK